VSRIRTVARTNDMGLCHVGPRGGLVPGSRRTLYRGRRFWQEVGRRWARNSCGIEDLGDTLCDGQGFVHASGFLPAARHAVVVRYAGRRSAAAGGGSPSSPVGRPCLRNVQNDEDNLTSSV
jgi:hypothetical protein